MPAGMNCALRRSLPRPALPAARRYSSLFGYSQASALVYSKYGQPKDVLSLHHHSIAPPHGSDLTVKFLAAPINPADINQLQGVYPSKPPFTRALGTPHPSAVAGNEGLVEVLSTGASASPFAPGDWALMRSTSFGTWRTHASAAPDALLKIPAAAVTPLQAATVSVNPCTAYRLLRDFAPLRPGDWFLQNGANSGVGRAAIQLGRLWGLRSVNVIRSRADAREEAALRGELAALGADVVVTEEEIADRAFKGALRGYTEGRGVAVGLNCVGGKATTDLARQLAPGGHLITYGAMSLQPITLPSSLFIFNDLHLHGFWVSAWSDKHPEQKQAMLDDIFGYIKSGEFKDVPTEQTVWRPDTKQDVLVAAVERSGKGFGKKQVFVFED